MHCTVAGKVIGGKNILSKDAPVWKEQSVLFQGKGLKLKLFISLWEKCLLYCWAKVLIAHDDYFFFTLQTPTLCKISFPALSVLHNPSLVGVLYPVVRR